MRLDALALVGLLLGAPARAASTVDLIEHLFGASNVNGVVGNGGLTIGISPLGDAAVLSWPSPSYCDQLLHLGRNDLEVRSLRNMAAAESMGAFIGVRVIDPSGATVVFPRRDWQVAQRFHDPRTARLTTLFTHAEARFDIRVEDHVALGSDTWVRKVRVEAKPGAAAIRQVEILGYWNLSPTVSRVPQLPLADWVMDAYNDYAALYSEADQAIVHYRPAGRGDITSIPLLVARPGIDYGPIGDALVEGAVDASGAAMLRDGLGREPEGAYFAITSDAPIVGHQIGFDRTPTCTLIDALADNIKALPEAFPDLTLPLDPGLADVLRCDLAPEALAADQGWTALPTAAFDDLQDGTLEGAFAAAGQVDAALAVRARAVGTAFEATFFLGAGADLANALDAARARDGLDSVLGLPEHTVLPTGAWRPEVAEVATRALVNLLLAQDRTTGAIVASVSRQAPYALDWPRDGAFFTAALDVAGLGERASARVPFVLSTQRREPVPAEPLINATPPVDPDSGASDTYPAGAWEMNNYADGMPGGNIRWEIDNTGLALWSLVEHARYLEGDARRAHEDAIFEAVARGADLLARWRDPATGLHAPTSEDDNVAYTQTLHGAITTWAALDAARRLAAARPELDTAARGPAWSARADELRQAILTHLVDPETHRFEEGLDETSNPGNAAGGPSAWALWPARFLRDDVPAEVAIREATEAWLLELAEARLDPRNGGSAYVAKLLVAVALGTRDEARRDKARALVERLATTTSTPDTRVFGEVFIGVDGDGDGQSDAFSARVSNPHVWAGTLVYLAAMALDAPERFDPVVIVPAPPRTRGGGEGCGGAPLGLAIAALVPWLRARAARSASGRRKS